MRSLARTRSKAVNERVVCRRAEDDLYYEGVIGRQTMSLGYGLGVTGGKAANALPGGATIARQG